MEISIFLMRKVAKGDCLFFIDFFIGVRVTVWLFVVIVLGYLPELLFGFGEDGF